MKYINFAKNLNENSLESVYVLQGDDAYFLKAAKEKILSVCKIENEQFNLSIFDESKKEDFFISLITFPIASKCRVSVITIDKMDDEFFKDLDKYVKNPNPDCVAIVLNNAKEILEKEGISIVDCSRESLSMLVRWVAVTFKKDGKTIDEKLCQRLVERCNFYMMKISSAVEAISCYLKDESIVTEQVIDELAPYEIDAVIFDLINAIIEKNAKQTLVMYFKFKSQKIDDTQIIALLYGNYRRMFLSVISEGSNEEVAAELKVKPYAIKKARELGKRYSKVRLKKCLDILIKLEIGIKTGRLINPDLMQVGILTLIEK